MIELLKENTWLISIIAIIISIISLTFVIIDKLKNWKDTSINKKLRKDKSILQPVIELKVENFSSVKTEKEKNLQRTLHKPSYSRLYHLFQSIDTSQLSNKDIAKKIERIKNFKAEDLFESKNIPNGYIFSIQFSHIVTEVISDSKKYLANVI